LWFGKGRVVRAALCMAVGGIVAGDEPGRVCFLQSVLAVLVHSLHHIIHRIIHHHHHGIYGLEHGHAQFATCIGIATFGVGHIPNLLLLNRVHFQEILVQVVRILIFLQGFGQLGQLGIDEIGFSQGVMHRSDKDLLLHRMNIIITVLPEYGNGQSQGVEGQLQRVGIPIIGIAIDVIVVSAFVGKMGHAQLQIPIGQCEWIVLILVWVSRQYIGNCSSVL
jgi:hypothetical protein